MLFSPPFPPSFFKDTPLGPLPEDWEIVSAGDIFRPSDLRVKHLQSTDLEIPVLSMTRLHGLVLQSEKFDKQVASRDLSNYKVVKKGQLVYSFPIDEGVIAILHRHSVGAVSPAYHVWDITREVDLTFLDMMLKTPALINYYKMHSSNVVHRRRNLSPKDFVNVPIPLPPLPEQRAIARVLTTVREAIEATDRVLTAARELKRSLMHHLFTYGPVPVNEADQVSLKETEIGNVPNEWALTRCDELCETVSVGIVVKPASLYVDSGVPAFRSLNIQEDRLVLDNLVYISQKANDGKVSKSRLKEGDVLIVRTGDPGKSCVVPKEFDGVNCIDLVFARPNSALVNSSYLSRFFNSQGGKLQVAKSKTGLAQQHLNVNSVKNTIVPLPDLDSQNKIANQLGVIDKKILYETDRKVALATLFQSLLHHLMTGKLRTLYPVPEYFIPTREPAYAVRETDPEVHVEALLIAALVNAQYQVSQHPVSRFRVTKLSYLYNSFTNRQEALENFGIYNFGPYNPQIRYGGVEETLQALGYLEQVDETHFQPGAQIGKAVQLASEYYALARIAQIVEEFGEFRDRTLELWTTVEYTARQIHKKGELVSAERVFEFWRKDAVWQAKTEKFTIEEIRSAMQGLRKVFYKFR